MELSAVAGDSTFILICNTYINTITKNIFYSMRKITLLMCFVLSTVFGLRAQNVTLPYVQDFAALTSGDMLSATGSSTAASASALQGIASVSRAYQAG